MLCGVIYASLLISCLYALYTNGSKLVLLYTPLLIFLVASLGCYIWHKKYADVFESFLVYISYVCAGFAFIFLAPIAIERSLSLFVFFYAVENDGYPASSVSDSYKELFFEKRLKDGVDGGFLTIQGNSYKPTIKAKTFYAILYPLGYATNALQNYHAFIAEVNANKHQALIHENSTQK